VYGKCVLSFHCVLPGVSKNRWIRLPVIVYSTHVATTLIPILFHIYLHDFSQDEIKGPLTLSDRIILSGFYLPYFIVPLILLVDALFHEVYVGSSKTVTSSNKSKQNRKKNY